MEQTRYYLAIDIGASSGRHILAHLEDGRMCLEEVHRFPNGGVRKNGHLYWDMDALWDGIITGIKKCGEIGKIPVGLGIDTWGVDYVLLDENDEPLADAVAYRDERTIGIDEKVYEIISETELYKKTGSQKQLFNTIYQLMADKLKEPEKYDAAKAMLMMPDYFNFCLTGVKMQEFSNASTTQLLDLSTGQWNYELIDMLGIKREIFQKIHKSGDIVGNLKPEIREIVGFDCKVILPLTHDTASAVAAVPFTGDVSEELYISSGTWSLMGAEIDKPICSSEAMRLNFTNEGGYDGRVRFLKSIMGLWMIQSVKKEIGGDLGFGEICDMAAKCDIETLVDVNDFRFMAPENMTLEIKKYCEETGQQVPEGIAETAAVIYNSLAVFYAKVLKEVESLTGVKYPCIHIIGGGSNAAYLNQLTAKKTGIPILAGPGEATSIGNLCAIMISQGEFADIMEARECIARSFEIRKFV